MFFCSLTLLFSCVDPYYPTPPYIRKSKHCRDLYGLVHRLQNCKSEACVRTETYYLHKRYYIPIDDENFEKKLEALKQDCKEEQGMDI